MDDTQIIELYFSRSESAIEKTAEKYGPYLNQVAYNILRCPEDTEEIVEDAYFAAWNKIPPERPRILKHFLSRITRNIAFDRLDYLTAKKRDPHMITLLSELDACVPDHKNDMEAIFDAKMIGETLNRFLSRLDRMDCAVFLCRYYYSMSISEISGRYGLSERTVKYRLSSLRRQLRKSLDEEGIVV